MVKNHGWTTAGRDCGVSGTLPCPDDDDCPPLRERICEDYDDHDNDFDEGENEGCNDLSYVNNEEATSICIDVDYEDGLEYLVAQYFTGKLKLLHKTSTMEWFDAQFHQTKGT